MQHPEFFSKPSFIARRIKEAKGKKPDYLDDYVKGIWEPTTTDLRAIKKMLRPYTAKYEAIYREMRHQIFAHTIATDAELGQLFSKALITDVEEILYGLKDIIEILYQLYYNGRRPSERTGKYDYKERIRDITRNVLRSVAMSPEQAPS